MWLPLARQLAKSKPSILTPCVSSFQIISFIVVRRFTSQSGTQSSKLYLVASSKEEEEEAENVTKLDWKHHPRVELHPRKFYINQSKRFTSYKDTQACYLRGRDAASQFQQIY